MIKVNNHGLTSIVELRKLLVGIKTGNFMQLQLTVDWKYPFLQHLG